MYRFAKYYFLLVVVFAACEEIYTPEIEIIENVIVADARIINGNTGNFVRLYESRGFNDENNNYKNISGATVYITDNLQNRIELIESSPGVFPVDITFNENYQYQMIIVHDGNVYESSFESVPKIPVLDTVYGVPETKLVIASGNNDAGDIREIEGLQLYTDILNEKEMPWYRFTARKIIQFTYPVEVPVPGGEILIETMFAWDSFYPRNLFNIAAPPEFSSTTNIIKHPLYFMEKNVSMGNDRSFAGWILILYPYGITKTGYNYYDDLNKQLGSEGKLFDPMYVQARSNLKCTSDSKRLILGNFEISANNEYRYFIRFISEKDGYLVKPIPYFYRIPEFGEQLTVPPDFWEHPYKTYPNEK